MKYSHLIQTPESSTPQTVQGLLQRLSKEREYDVVRVAMAYVTVAGVRTLLEGFRENQIRNSQWLVGLDDCISQPGAIDLLNNFEHATLRVVGLQKQGRRFHPKICYVNESAKTESGFLMLGSANLTKTGLRGNAEAVAVFHPESRADQSELMELWKITWKLGHEPTATEIEEYQRRYEAVRPLRKKIEQLEESEKKDVKRSLILDTDAAELDPSLATTCWIECGYITAMGRELEFKAEQGLFFGLDPSGGAAKELRFELSNGVIETLRMKYQGNHMWRLQLNNSVPEVANGLRPVLRDGSLGRSEFVAVFERKNGKGLFSIRFLKLTESSYANLLKRSERYGTVGHTSARTYGWC